MEIGPLLLMTGAFSLLLLLVQRTERRRRLAMIVLGGLAGYLIVRYVNYRGIHAEAQLAFILALVGNFFFWLLIGRYNPVKSSDEMKVLGMDD